MAFCPPLKAFSCSTWRKRHIKPINESDQTATLIKLVALGCKALQKKVRKTETPLRIIAQARTAIIQRINIGKTIIEKG